MQVSAVISPSPSFNSYSHSNLAQIAARVVQEFRDEDDVHKQEKTTIQGVYETEMSDSAEKEEFEFAFVRTDSESSPLISADEIFRNGQIRPLHPIIKPNLLLGSTKYHGSVDDTGMNSGLLKGMKIGTPLRKLFTEERETSTTSSCSSSEADELDGVPAEMHCVWRPKSSVEGRLKKSSSTGWKFKGFLQKSHSVGSHGSFPVSQHGARGLKGDFVYLSSSRTASKCMPPLPYKRCDVDNRRFYRHDLVGFFANVNKMTKNFHPF